MLALFTLCFICLSRSESVSLQSLELLQAIYPSGIEGALEIGCQIWSRNDIEVCNLSLFSSSSGILCIQGQEFFFIYSQNFLFLKSRSNVMNDILTSILTCYPYYVKYWLEWIITCFSIITHTSNDTVDSTYIYGTCIGYAYNSF